MYQIVNNETAPMDHAPPPRMRALPRRSDRRRARTRAALLEAGRALYALRGLDAVSVDEIVAAADVAKGSFYNHFHDKDGLAREIAGEVRRQTERLVEDANAGVGDPAMRIARALCVFIRYAIDHRDSAQVLWRLNSGATVADAPANRSLRAEVERGIATGCFSQVDVYSGVLLIMGTVVISMRHALEERASMAPTALARGMAAGLLRALGTPARLAARTAAHAADAIFAHTDPTRR
jgi:AcrR family transcriptional regulator